MIEIRGASYKESGYMQQSEKKSDGESDSDSEHDLEWDVLQQNADENCDGDGGEVPVETPTRNTISLPPSIKCQDEPMFSVFHSALLILFSLFCFKYQTENPKVSMAQNRTMVTASILQIMLWGIIYCTWRSQPFVHNVLHHQNENRSL